MDTQSQPSNWKTKAAIIGVVALVIAALVFIIKYQHDLLQRQQTMEQSVVEMKRLQDGWVRSSDKYVTKDDLDKFAKDAGVDLGPVQKDLKDLGAEIKGISAIVARTPGFNGTNINSTTTVPRSDNPTPVTVKCPDGKLVNCPNVDPFGYQKNTQVLKLDEPFSDKTAIPWGDVKFSAWREKPWDLDVKKRQYSVVTVVSTNEEGRHFVHNKFQVEVDDKKYDVPITTSNFVEVYPSNTFRFSPQLFLGLDAGIHLNSPLRGDVVPNLQLALFSYGQTKVNPTWVFLGLGSGYEINDGRLNFMVSPFMYNVGEPLPLVRNLYIGPSLSVDMAGSVGLFGGIHVGL